MPWLTIRGRSDFVKLKLLASGLLLKLKITIYRDLLAYSWGFFLSELFYAFYFSEIYVSSEENSS